MAVRFVTSWNGYQAGDRATLSNESALIAGGIARNDYQQDGPFHGVGEIAEWNPTATALVHPVTGREASQSNIDSVLPPTLNWLQLRSSYKWDVVTVPSPYAPGHVLHPSVLYFYNGWRGYRYWMAYTPYPNSDSNYENPCVAASHDGLTWVAQGAQPLFPKPDGAGKYNSDTDIVYDKAADRLVMLFRSNDSSGGQQRLKITTSTDGQAWSDPVVIYTSANNGTSSSTDLASPSLIWNETSARWEIFGNVIRDTASAWPLGRIVSTTLLSGWETTPTLLTATPFTGRKFWHSTIRRLSTGAYVGLIQDNNNTTGGDGNLLAASSEDGTTWSIRLIDDRANRGYAWYRPAFVTKFDLLRNEWVVEAFLSRLNTAGMYRQVLRFDAADHYVRAAAEVGAIMQAASIGGVSNIIAADNFNRANDATGLGTSTSGGTYTQPNGPTDVIGISGNAAYNVTTGNCRALVATSVYDYDVRVTVKTQAGTGNWLNLRCVDNSNFLRVGTSGPSDQLRFQRITSGSVAVNTTLGITPVAPFDLRVTCCGGEIVIYCNGTYIARVAETQGAVTATTLGLQMAGSAGAMDNFIAVGIPA